MENVCSVCFYNKTGSGNSVNCGVFLTLRGVMSAASLGGADYVTMRWSLMTKPPRAMFVS